MECCIINPALLLLMKHLVIGQRQKAPNFLAIHSSPQRNLVSIGQQLLTTRVVHLPKRTETSLITEADIITQLDQAVRAVHSGNSWFLIELQKNCFYYAHYFKCKILQVFYFLSYYTVSVSYFS